MRARFLQDLFTVVPIPLEIVGAWHKPISEAEPVIYIPLQYEPPAVASDTPGCTPDAAVEAAYSQYAMALR